MDIESPRLARLVRHLFFHLEKATMNSCRRRIASVFIAIPFLFGLAGCGGEDQVEVNSPVEAGPDAADACVPISCVSNSTWSASQCRCIGIDGSVRDSASDGSADSANANDAMADAADTGPDGSLDASAEAAPDSSANQLDAPGDVSSDTGSDGAVAVHDAMADVSVGHDSSSLIDATPPPGDSTTGLPDSGDRDSSGPSADSAPYDVIPIFDSPIAEDTGISPWCAPIGYTCPNGYVMDSMCKCELCSMTCPAGETPGSGCQSCVACPYSCPAGYDLGPNCACTPHVTDSGIDTGTESDSGDSSTGVHDAEADASDASAASSCLLGGSVYCNVDSWCQMGVCPDGKTQYGCYCNSDGTSSCSLNCPGATSCEIPGESGECPLGSNCMYGSCSSSSSAVLICNCYNNGSVGIGIIGGSGGTGTGGVGIPYPVTGGSSGASCYTTTCGDLDGGSLDSGTSYYIPDGGPVQPGCLIEGYLGCPAGQYCALGTCPNGTTYGCTCNLDGGADCKMNCGTTDCVIPGEGTCRDGTSCNFGSCEDAGASILSCSCYAGSASCYTQTCSSLDGG